MDYADNFIPKPVIGERYTTIDGKNVVVDDIQSDEGVVYVFCHYEGDNPNTLFPNKEEWEAMFSKYNDFDSNTDDGRADDDFDDKSDVDGTNDDNADVNDTDDDAGLHADNKPNDDGSPTGNKPNDGTPTNNNTVDDETKTDTDDSNEATVEDGDFSDYLRKVIEPINRLRKLLQQGITLPFQILKLESEEDIPAQFSDPNVTKACQEELDKIHRLRAEGEKTENHGSWVEEKMWSFGAYDKPMLRMFRQDHGAKTGMGAAIFMTALLALCTGTYAFYKISGSTVLAGLLGLIWGTMIYVLDRNIVTSMAYTGEKNRRRRFWKSCGTVSLRLVIAVFIGIVISAPVELLIFNGKINEYKEFEHEQFVKREIASMEYEIAKEKLNNKERLEKDLDSIRARKDWEERNPEAPHRGPEWKKYAKQEDATQQLLDKNQKELESLDNIYQSKKREFTEAAEQKWKKHEDYFDLSTDLAILFKITAKVEDKKLINEEAVSTQTKNTSNTTQAKDTSNSNTNDGSIQSEVKNNSSRNNKSDSVDNAIIVNAPANVQNAEINPALPLDNTMHKCRLFITLLFTLIEVIPVITKLFFKAGDYDKKMVRWAYLEARMHRIENANCYNQTINGALSKHRKYILGEEFEEIDRALQSDENHEDDDDGNIDNITLPIKGCLRTAKDYNDWKNLRRWKYAIEKADAYLQDEINKLFPQLAAVDKHSQPEQPQASMPPSTDDPSADGEVID